MNVLVAIPHTGNFNYMTTHSLLNLHRTHIRGFSLIGLSLVYEAREKAVEMLLSEPRFDAIMFLDSDMAPDADLIDRLVAHDKDIVSAMAFKRTEPYEPCFFKSIDVDNGVEFYTDYPKYTPPFTKDPLLKVAGVGMACCLIKRQVFEKMPRPLFHPLTTLGEDLAFCKRATEAGFEIFVDTSITCKHVTMIPIDEIHYQYCKDKGMVKGVKA